MAAVRRCFRKYIRKQARTPPQNAELKAEGFFNNGRTANGSAGYQRLVIGKKPVGSVYQL